MKCPKCPTGALIPFGNTARCWACKHEVHAQGARRVVHEAIVAADHYDAPDRNGCAVRAYALAAQMSAASAREKFAAAGRRIGKGTPIDVIDRVFGRKADYVGHGATLVSWVRDHPRGRYFVVVTGHALAVVDGVVQGLNPYKPRSRVQMAWRLLQNSA